MRVLCMCPQLASSILLLSYCNYIAVALNLYCYCCSALGYSYPIAVNLAVPLAFGGSAIRPALGTAVASEENTEVISSSPLNSISAS